MDTAQNIRDFLPEYAHDDEFNQIRARLLQNNFVLHKILKKFRDDYDIPKKGFKSQIEYSRWIGKSFRKSMKTLEEIGNKLSKYVTKLHIDPKLLFSLVCFGDSRLFIGNWYVYSVGLRMPGGNIFSDSIKTEGVYIIVDPLMGKKDILRAFEQAKTVMSLFYKDKRRVAPYRKRKDKGYAIDRDMKDYIEIEKEILESVKDKEIEEDRWTKKSGRRSSIVDRALEEIVARRESSGDSKKENALKNRLEDAYYRIARRYFLPTLEDLPNLELLK